MNVLAVTDLGDCRGRDVGDLGVILVVEECDMIAAYDKLHASSDLRVGKRTAVVNHFVPACGIRREGGRRNDETQDNGKQQSRNFHLFSLSGFQNAWSQAYYRQSLRFPCLNSLV